MIESKKSQNQLYFLHSNQNTEKVGEPFVDDFNHVAKKFVEDRFNSKLTFTDKSKIDIQNDINYDNQYILFSNNSLYKKESVELKGYLWNSSSVVLNKIGKFIVISSTETDPIDNIETTNQSISINKENIKQNKNLFSKIDKKNNPKKQKRIVQNNPVIMQCRKNNFKKVKRSVNEDKNLFI